MARAGLPNVAAAGATLSRTQRTTASAIGQCSVAAGSNVTSSPFLSTTASKRTTSLAPQAFGPAMASSGCTTAMSGVRRNWQAERVAGGPGASAADGGIGAGALATGGGGGFRGGGSGGGAGWRVG